MKTNPTNQIEGIWVKLTPEVYPIAYQNKVDELVEQGAVASREEAEKLVKSTPIYLELYYEKHHGLFAVESEALETTPEVICSPYTQEAFEDTEEI